MPSPVMDVHLIVNPASGARLAEKVLRDDVLPLLRQHSPPPTLHEHWTECEDDGARIARELVEGAAQPVSPLVLVLLGGDGTTHEVLNGIVEQRDGRCSVRRKVRLALVPTGTANALYASLYPGQHEGSAYRLNSVRALLAGQADEYPLALTSVSTGAHDLLIAHLITSHALHASILADSEALRSTHPGIERFKIAAAQNISRWVNARVQLTPRAGKLQRYDPESKAFIDVALDEGRFDGPILYFVCVSTDRLEPTFVPAPFSGPWQGDKTQQQRPSDAVDVVVIRPLSDPALQSEVNRDGSFWLHDESATLREDYAKDRVQAVVGGMYDEGKHVDLRYDGSGPPICEYYRCAGYDWTPVSSEGGTKRGATGSR